MPRSPDSAEDGSKARQTPYVLGLIFVILAAGIVTAGYLYYWNYEQHYRAGVERQLSAIAELKTHELTEWRRARLGDAAVFFKNAAFSALVRRYFDNPADAEARAHLQTWLGLVQAHLLYDRVFLLDTRGVERISAPDTSEPACSHLAQDASETLRLGRVTFIDFNRHAPNGPVHLEVLAPILDGQDGGRPLGVLVLRIDPETYLYPYLSRWPTPSRSAETLLVRRDGNDALFLNNLRFQKDAALNLRGSLEEGKDLPAVKAAMGQEGIVEGADYRGEPVIADVRAVPDSPWFLVARMDAAEVYAPVRGQLWQMEVFVGVLLLAAGAGLGLVWRQQSVRFYREKSEVAEALRESEAIYRTLAENIPQKVFMKGRDLRYVSMNENYARDLGIRPAEAVGKADYDFFPKELADKYRADDRRILEMGRTDELDEKYIQGGKEVWVHTVKTPVRDWTGEIVGVFGIFWDITERKRAEEALQKANQRLEALATTDELTGLANRRRFTETLHAEMERAKRHGSPLALAMLDVDGFKAINDTHGHAFGDRVLVEIGKTLRGGARVCDIVARYGGDEFMILMPETRVEEALGAIERVRKAFAHRTISDGRRSLQVTVSAGVSGRKTDGVTTADALVRLADEALYAAKHSGRDRTLAWSQIRHDQAEETLVAGDQVETLRREVAKLGLQSKEVFVENLRGLVRALEARDAYTKAHSENVTRYAVAIAETLELDPEETGVIRRAAMVHDIGKIGVPDGILRKRGPLDDHGRRVMQGHVLTGVKIIGQMHFLEREVLLVRHHHEWWNGEGYPDGIAGEAIPLGARILAVADAFDAITSDRVYRNARGVSDALRILVEESGRQFDASVVDAMVKWVLRTGRELGKESDLAVADLLETPAVSVPG